MLYSRTSGLIPLTKGCLVAVLAGVLLGLGLSHVVRSSQVTWTVTQPTLGYNYRGNRLIGGNNPNSDVHVELVTSAQAQLAPNPIRTPS